MAEINLGKVVGGAGGGGDVSKQSITNALGFPVKDIVIISQSEYDALPPFAREGERLFFIKDKLGKIFYKNEPIWDDPWDGTFADPQVGQILFDAELIADPTKTSEEEVAGITSIDGIFADKFELASFDEFKYFTGVTSLGNGCFWNCNRLESITLPESLTSLGAACFTNCSALYSITLPAGLTSLGEECFERCSWMHSITIPESVTSMRDKCFNECTALTSVNIQGGVTSLGKMCFSSCHSLKSITLPESLTSIGETCFHGCWNLESITLPEGFTSLGDMCFYNCESFTSITIPESVTSIGETCFGGCDDLTLVTVLPVTPPTLGTNAFPDGGGSSISIKVPSSSVNTYKTDPNWVDYSHMISAI